MLDFCLGSSVPALGRGGYFRHTGPAPLQRSFQGCMQLIHVDDQLANLHAVEQGTLGSFENVSLDMCAIIDR
ncbi:contactin-associated protein-like 2 [Arapaima gigas]